MPLSDTACKNAHKNVKASMGKALFDDKDLHLLVKPTSTGWAKWWRLKYRSDGKSGLISLGVYPDISLQQARERRDAIRKQLAEGIKESKAALAENSFEIIAREWGQKRLKPGMIKTTVPSGCWSVIYSPGWVANQ
jgi:hypothetical protein